MSEQAGDAQPSEPVRGPQSDVPGPAPMRRAFGIGIAFFVVGYVLYASLMGYFQRRFIYIPRAYPMENVTGLLPARGTAVPYDSPSGRQFVYVVDPPRADPAAPVWFVFGGNASLALDFADWVEAAQKDQPTWTFVLVDYPGYGRNEGAPSRKAIAESVDAAREAVRQRLNLDSNALRARTAVFGHSIGSAIGSEFAARHGATQIVLVSPFTSLRDMVVRTLGWTGWPMQFLLLDRFDTEARLREIERMQPRPRLRIFHGNADEIVPASMGRKLAANHPGWIEYVELDRLDHNFIIETVRPRITLGS